MKRSKIIALSLVSAALAVAPFAGWGAEAKKAKPYPLATCVVSDEKLGTDPSMKPYSFVHEGQEVKLCCKSCLKDFNKNQAAYLKKIADAQKKDK
jgi:hypothetical protein